MLEIKYATKFKKDLKVCQKRHGNRAGRSTGHQCSGCPGGTSSTEQRPQSDGELYPTSGMSHTAGLAADLSSDGHGALFVPYWYALRFVWTVRGAAMTCQLCKGEMKPSTTIHTVQLKNCVVVIKNVPCLKCEQCGEVVLSADTVEKIEHILQTVEKAVAEITVVNFPDCAA